VIVDGYVNYDSYAALADALFASGLTVQYQGPHQTIEVIRLFPPNDDGQEAGNS
jgi:hypothetical protein